MNCSRAFGCFPQFSALSAHSLEYVLPSLPHTGKAAWSRRHWSGEGHTHLACLLLSMTQRWYTSHRLKAQASVKYKKQNIVTTAGSLFRGAFYRVRTHFWTRNSRLFPHVIQSNIFFSRLRVMSPELECKARETQEPTTETARQCRQTMAMSGEGWREFLRFYDWTFYQKWSLHEVQQADKHFTQQRGTI